MSCRFSIKKSDYTLCKGKHPMQNEEIADLLNSQLNLDEVHVSGEGNHYQIIAVSDQFDSMSRVKRQQQVYAPLADIIAQGTIHAVSIKTFTLQQWQREKALNMPS
jgi:acid stress-induced BolA-like protein IbaG/YrbA